MITSINDTHITKPCCHKAPAPEAGDCQLGIDTIDMVKITPTPWPHSVKVKGRKSSEKEAQGHSGQAGREQASCRVNAGAGGVITDVESG